MTPRSGSPLAEELARRLPDDQLHSRDSRFWFGLYRQRDGHGGTILTRDRHGRLSAWTYATTGELEDSWQALRAAHDPDGDGRPGQR